MVKTFPGLLIFCLISISLSAQIRKQDSIEVVKTFGQLIALCRNIDFSDPKTREQGTFYKAAPYIIYQGDDDKRKWKDFANYANQKEKEGVDATCIRINQTVNQDSNYVIHHYVTKKESEGTWHALLISYKKKGKEKKVLFGFLKIGKRYGLGDID